MSLLFETICVKYGIPQHLIYHQERVNRTFYDLFGTRAFDVSEAMTISEDHRKYPWLRAKLIYNQQGVTQLKFFPYEKRQITRLTFIELEDQVYSYKFLDRHWIESITEGLAPDEEVIFTRDGLILESSYCNIALRKHDRWFTPKYPLHHGTTLMRLKQNGYLIPHSIQISDWDDYEEIRLFNAMLGWGKSHKLIIG